MDLAGRRHYVARAMSILLVLSAMLSAVTGAFASTRAAEPASHHQAQVAPAAEAVEQVVALAARHETAGAEVVPLVFPSPRPAPPAAAPLATDRLIE